MPGTLFKYPKEGASREFILLLDALENLVLAVHAHYARLESAARSHLADPSRSTQASPDALIITPRVLMFADAGGLIGTVQRLRLLAAKLPGDADTKLAKRIFESVAKVAEPARHHLEHIDGALAPSAAIGIGALGTVTWWFVNDAGKRGVVSLVSWSFPSDSPKASFIVPGEFRNDVDHFSTLVGGESIDISGLYRAVEQLEGRLTAWCEKQESLGWPILKAAAWLRAPEAAN